MPEPFTVYGMSDLLYRAPSLDLPQLKQANISVAGIAQIITIGGIKDSSADRALCLPLKLTLAQKTDVDLKAALIVQNSLGWDVARADAIFADAAQQTTSQLAPGDSLTAYPLLRLPYGAPAGSYSIWLRVYDEKVQSYGYDLLSGDDPIHKDLLIGSWTVSSGMWEQVTRTTDLHITTEVRVNADLALIGHNGADGIFHNGDGIRLASSH